jgi:NAD(P)-dependent dehydrogenase (short-subunit alcohol dehydrogenase family)
MKYVLITGTNSGIGEAITQGLIAKGYHVFGSVRDEKNAKNLSSRFGQNFTPLVFDITDEKAVEKSVSIVKEKLNSEGLTALVNNAGMSVIGPLKDMSVSDFRKQIDVNLTGAFIVTKYFLPLLGADKNANFKPGRIINISSLSGTRTVPFIAAYAISKHGMEAFTDGLRRELMLYGIDVIGILPGSVKTPMIDKIDSGILNAANDSDYQTMLLKFKDMNEKKVATGVPIEKVVRTVFTAIESSNPKPRYYLRTSFIADFLLPAFLPTRLMDLVFAKLMGIKREGKK